MLPEKTVVPERKALRSVLLSDRFCNCVLASAIPRQNGLELYIDGRRTDIIRVNKAFAGAHIEKGTHKIEFRFSPPGKQIGCIISLISLLCYLSYLIFTFGVFTSRKTQNITTAHHKNAL